MSRHIVEAIKDTKWTIVITLLLTAFMAGWMAPYLERVYHSNTPVVRMSGELVSHQNGVTVLHVKGEKLRDCKFIRLSAAYKFKGNGMLVDAFYERIGAPYADGSSKPIGKFDLGKWKVWPTDDAESVLMFVQHDCNGVTVLTKIAEVNV